MLSALKSLIVILFILVVGGSFAFLWFTSNELEVEYDRPKAAVKAAPRAPRAAEAPRAEVPETAKPVSLTSTDGRTISAHLISKTSTSVTFISNKRRYTLLLNRLDEASKQTVRDWTPPES